MPQCASNFVHHFWRVAVTVAALCMSPMALVLAADFSGKTIEWIIPFKAGGGSDNIARFYAPLLSRALPGNPTVVVKNVPGAGSTKGANWFHQNARPNGLTILGTSGSTQFPYMLGDRRVKYDYKDWSVILASPTGGVVYLDPALGVESIADIGKLKGKKLLFGSQGVTSLDLVALLAFELLGLRVDPIFGMRGRAAARLAFENGDTNIDYQTSSAFLSKVIPIVADRKAVPVMTWGALDGAGNLIRDPTFPELPHFAEIYKMSGKKPDGAAFQAWKAFFTAGFPAQKMVFLPKGTQRDIFDAYSAAFNAVIGTRGFKEKSKKQLGIYPQSTGEAARAKLKVATGVPAEAKAFVKKWLRDRFGVEL